MVPVSVSILWWQDFHGAPILFFFFCSLWCLELIYCHSPLFLSIGTGPHSNHLYIQARKLYPAFHFSSFALKGFSSSSWLIRFAVSRASIHATLNWSCSLFTCDADDGRWRLAWSILLLLVIGTAGSISMSCQKSCHSITTK